MNALLPQLSQAVASAESLTGPRLLSSPSLVSPYVYLVGTNQLESKKNRVFFQTRLQVD